MEHAQANFYYHSGQPFTGFPTLGAWVSYGLGSMTDELPTFVVVPDTRGFAPNGPGNHSAGFLPASSQGTMMRVGRQNAIHDLFPPDSAKFITPAVKQAGWDGIVVQGRADRPVYLWIEDEDAQIRDASHLWGQITGPVEDALRAELGDQQIRVCQIGPAGENLVRYACIVNDLNDVAGPI